jgi:hypothetical protein
MKRLLLFLLVPLLLVSCSRPHRFTKGEDGAYVDARTDITYTLLDPMFEPAVRGDEWGAYEDEKSGFTRTFFTVGTLDPALFLADDMRCVYYAGSEALKPETFTVTAAILCYEDATSVEHKRFTAADHAAVLTELRTLWFEGAADAELPELTEPTLKRRVKLTFAEYPSLYYCFTFAVYESGAAYLYEIGAGRTVAVPAALADTLQNG